MVPPLRPCMRPRTIDDRSWIRSSIIDGSLIAALRSNHALRGRLAGGRLGTDLAHEPPSRRDEVVHLVGSTLATRGRSLPGRRVLRLSRLTTHVYVLLSTYLYLFKSKNVSSW